MFLSARDELLDEVREKLKDKLTVTGLEQVIDTSMLIKKYLNERDDPYEALIVGRGIDRVTPPGVRAMLKRIENRVEELSNVHPHRFRRILATGLLNKGMPIQEVACILGHENINTTMTYVHVDKQSVKSDFSKYFGNV